MNRAGKVITLASLAAALGFYVFHLGLAAMPWPLGLKGAAVGLLAVAALVQGTAGDARLLAVILACGAVGDIAIETSVVAGALAFLIGHGVAIGLYVKNRRAGMRAGQVAAALGCAAITALIAYVLPADRALAPLVAIYALGLGGMAASAGISRFARHGAALGAWLFVASDLMIFAGMGPLGSNPIPQLVIWPLYYCGQYLICQGVLQALRADQASV